MQVVRTVTTTLSVPEIAPLYGIIAPNHDFTEYNRERASSGVAVRKSIIIIITIMLMKHGYVSHITGLAVPQK